MSKLKFYRTGEDWDIFSNVTPISVHISINGQEYNAASFEAVYQCCKERVSRDSRDVTLSRKLLTDSNAFGGKVQHNAKGFTSSTFSHYHQSYSSSL